MSINFEHYPPGPAVSVNAPPAVKKRSQRKKIDASSKLLDLNDEPVFTDHTRLNPARVKFWLEDLEAGRAKYIGEGLDWYSAIDKAISVTKSGTSEDDVSFSAAVRDFFAKTEPQYCTTVHYQEIRALAAAKLEMTDNELWLLHKAKANLRDYMTKEVLVELEEEIQNRIREREIADCQAAGDFTDVGISPEDLEEEEVQLDIFAAFDVEEDVQAAACEVIETHKETFQKLANDTQGVQVTVGPHEYHEGYFEVLIDGNGVETFQSEQEAKAAITDWQRCVAEDIKEAGGIEAWKQMYQPSKDESLKDPSKYCAVCQDVGINKQSPVLKDGRKVCKRCQLDHQNQQSTAGTVNANAATESVNAEPVSTEQGLIDPETGELLEPSFILEKLGWTEMPALNNDSTDAVIRDFESKLDQMVDRVLSCQEKPADSQAIFL